jgi:hypothetical protein
MNILMNKHLCPNIWLVMFHKITSLLFEHGVGSNRVDLLNVHLNKLGQAILIEVEDEVMHEIKMIANDDKRKFVCKFGLLEEILDFLHIVMVTLMADMLDFSNLPSMSCCLDVLEMNLGILTEVDNQTEVVVKTYSNSEHGKQIIDIMK